MVLCRKNTSYIADQIKRQMTELIKKKNKVTDLIIKISCSFVRCQIVNPAFDQTKETQIQMFAI